MNDYQDDLSKLEQLQQEIYRLKEENLFLKDEVNRLRNQATGLNSLNNNNYQESELVDYYVTRYNEIHNYVLDSRLSSLKEDIDKAQSEYEELSSKEDMIETIAKRNNEITYQMEKIKDEIDTNNNNLQKLKHQFEIEAELVTNNENNIFYTTVDYYNTLLNKLSIGNFDEINKYLNFVIDVIKYTLYDEVIKYHQNAKDALHLLDQVHTLEYEVKNQNLILQNEYEELSQGIEIISFEETEKKLDALAYEITNKKTAIEELTKLFEDLQKKNIKSIKDEIRHLQILEYSNQNIALKLDEMVLNYKDELSIVDTTSNIIAHKKIELQKLNDKMEIIYPKYQEYQSLQEDYHELQNVYQVVNDNIENVEKYISQSKKLIDSSNSFRNTIKEYTEISLKIKSIKSSLESVEIREKTLAETRKQILNDPYGKTDLIRVDDELRQTQATLATYKSEYTSSQSRLYSLKENEQDAKIIAIYEETLICEKQLPVLYNKQKELSNLISEKYKILSESKDMSNEYQSLKQQIQDIDNEIDNLQ